MGQFADLGNWGRRGDRRPRELRCLPVLQLGFWGCAYFSKGDKLVLRGQVSCVPGRARQVHVFAQRHPEEQAPGECATLA